MKKIIFAVAAFAALTAMDTAPAAAQSGCRTTFDGNRIVNVCSSPVFAPRFPGTRCVQRPGFNQPYICR